MTLETLTLDQIPALTDEEIDRLYAWLRILTEADGWHGSTKSAYLLMEDDERGLWHAQIDQGILPPRAVSAVCVPDCPASVLEGLPALVERRTGVPVCWRLFATTGIEGWRVTFYHHDGTEIYSGQTFRHLPHACLSAAVAACIVLGRRQS